MIFFSAHLSRASIMLGGIMRGCIDPSKRTDAKSLESTIKSSGLTAAFIDDCFQAHGEKCQILNIEKY